MWRNMSACCFFLLLLNVVGAKPISDLQSLKQLFEDELNTKPSSSSEEEEETRLRADGSSLGAAEQQQPWYSPDLSSSKENAPARLLKDFLRTSKRSWRRYKNGGLRSCFGVRLERIGSFSGLGC